MPNKEIKLKRSYVAVAPEGQADSFGGNQSWFDDGARKAYAIKSSGCGLIGASDIILYLESSLSDKKVLNVDDYKTRVRELEKSMFHVLPKLGIGGPLLALYMTIYFSRHKKELGLADKKLRARWFVMPGKLLRKIKEMLQNDIPVILAVGPGYFHKDKVNLYRRDVAPDGTATYTRVNGAKDHYITVTGILQEPEGIYLEVSSWGKKYYMSWAEYKAYVKKCDNYYFSNIVYIKKK